MVLPMGCGLFRVAAAAVALAAAGGFQALWAQDGGGAFGAEAPRAEAPGAGVIFDPYVSGLRAEAAGMTVNLSWRDSERVTGPVYVYRSKEPFYGGTTSNRFETIRVPYGARSFMDTVPADGTWFYLVVASEKDSDQRYEMVVPLNNMLEIFIDGGLRTAQATSWKVPQSTPPMYAGAQAAEGRPNPSAFRNQALSYGNGGMGDALPFADMAASPFSGISATPQDGGVLVQFMGSSIGKNAVLYRAITPIRKFGDLLVATVVKLGVSSPHMDYVTPGVPYYYAVVYEEDLMNGQALLVPGNNATLAPVETSRTVAQPAAQTPAGGIPQGGYAPVPATAGGRMLVLMDTRVFNEERRQYAPGTDEAELAEIVQRTVTWRNWAEGRGALAAFLTAKQRGAAVEARAHFYMGECAYFLGLYREALPEFVAAQSAYPVDAATWVQACLAKIAGR